jgi:methylated-DNA-[protein]-cysteine S-methyltransferase
VVGQACGGNPIPVVVPCHRVLAAGGRIGGYSAGKGRDTKRWLLGHEARAGLFALQR